MTYEHEIEERTDKAHLASELRILGFSEKAISNMLDMDTYAIRQIIRKYTDAKDLMGDETD